MDEDRTVFCGNLCDQVTDSILFELFNQAGPVETVRRPKDPSTGRPKSYGFIVYKHDCSVPYAVELFRTTTLFNRYLTINTRSRARHVPVLDTHINDSSMVRMQPSHSHKRSRDDAEYRKHRKKRKKDSRSHRHRGNRRDEDHKSHKDLDSKPSSWSVLKGEGGHTANSLHQNDLQSSSMSRTNYLYDPRPDFYGAQNPPDFSAMLQLGQQMMIPGMLSPMALPNRMPMVGMGLGPGLGAGPNMFPSMQADYDGGRVSPDRHRHQMDYQDDRHSRRDLPYDRQHEQRDDHHEHGRRYSSSRSSPPLLFKRKKKKEKKERNKSYKKKRREKRSPIQERKSCVEAD